MYGYEISNEKFQYLLFVGNIIVQHPLLFQERLLLMFRDMYASAVLNAKSVVIHIYFQTQK